MLGFAGSARQSIDIPMLQICLLATPVSVLHLLFLGTIHHWDKANNIFGLICRLQLNGGLLQLRHGQA